MHPANATRNGSSASGGSRAGLRAIEGCLPLSAPLRRYVREAALTTLARLELEPSEAIGCFLPRLLDENEAVRAAALRSLGRVRPEEFGVEHLIEVLRRLQDSAWTVSKGVGA